MMMICFLHCDGVRTYEKMALAQAAFASIM